MRNRRLRENPDYLDIMDGSKQLYEWSKLLKSSLIVIKGSFGDRGKARDIAASIIAIVKKSRRPVVWALTLQFGNLQRQLSNLDILKHLVLQILQINSSLLEDRTHPLSATNFQLATTESEWFELLSLVLTGIQEIYMVIDIEILRRDFENGQAWPSAFAVMFQKLAARSPRTIVKVAIISYHTRLNIEASSLTQTNVIRLNNNGRLSRATTKRSGTFKMCSNRSRHLQ